MEEEKMTLKMLNQALLDLMYDLLEYSYNYSGTTENLGFYSKYEATNFNVNIAKTTNFKNFEYKDNLLGNTVAQTNPHNANETLRNATIAVSFKCLSNFRRSL